MFLQGTNYNIFYINCQYIPGKHSRETELTERP
jgi:hypothetical protein